MVKFLCILGLAFGSKNELIGSPSNGNYLGIFEFLSEYDAFLAEHTGACKQWPWSSILFVINNL